LRLSDAIYVLDILNELMAVLRFNLCQEHMEVSQSADFNIINIILQESFHSGNQISLGYFRSQDSCQFVYRASKSFLNASIIEFSELQIDLSELIPPLSAESIYKCGEIE
jgi:hypothetical protein